jgi:DNA-binding MarR family transcriptional regulator
MKNKRPHRDQRYRDKCFPDAQKEVFSPEDGGYAPLPYIARELLRHLKGAELKVWVYLLTRGGPQSICYPTYEDILRGTGLATKGTVSKAINRLERIGLIRVHNDEGTRRYLLRDARLAVERLFELKEITRDQLEEANDLLETLKLPLIEPKTKPVVVRMPVKKASQGTA